MVRRENPGLEKFGDFFCEHSSRPPTYLSIFISMMFRKIWKGLNYVKIWGFVMNKDGM